MALSAADALVAPVTRIDGFVLACLVDASTGMLLASAQDDAQVSVPVAAAGAADLAALISMLTGRLAQGDELEDVLMTFSGHVHIVRFARNDALRRIVLLVILDRSRANLALARREIRNFCAGLAT